MIKHAAPSNGAKDIEDWQATVASRAPGFHQAIANQFLSMEPTISVYRTLVRKGQLLDIEFLEGDWPDYRADIISLEKVYDEIKKLDPSLTPLDLSEVLRIVRNSP
jgi:hypothetical protein